MTRAERDTGLEPLLQLDGEIFPMDNGYWVKFKVHLIQKSTHIPHGICYSLSLHDRYNRRVVGYDNAHGVKPSRKNSLAEERSGITSIEIPLYFRMSLKMLIS